eukprot:Nitzschia sp. Nitz4//scaffold348_size17284//12793//16374//NITZ4_008844-RA/size17284-processed-gene-0.12-mRNA-1//-1//CDS//3329548694//6241//frame0
MSFLQQWGQDATHALQDLYGSWVLGDDAGESSTMVLIVSAVSDEDRIQVVSDNPRYKEPLSPGKRRWPIPSPSSAMHRGYSSSKNQCTVSPLGVTFCDIAGRAYVQEVENDSRAERAGLLARDCIQYAAVLATEWADPLGADADEIRLQALEQESSGHRVCYREVKDMLSLQSVPTLSESDADDGTYLRPREAAVPMTIQVGGHGSKSSGTSSQPTSPHHSSANGSTLPPPPSKQVSQVNPPVLVLVIRRTKQRPAQSLPIWPNFRLDDECDVACDILSSLAAAGSIPSEGIGSCMGSPQMTSDGTGGQPPETIEAATIRGMVQSAHGLAFLRCNKFVMGVSVHAGSGVVIARLPDGTWSAPSAIGVTGFGLGLQLGLEVVHSIVILKTKEALEHFQRGGNFSAGANVGAAVGGMGREAIGAASLSGLLCGQAQALEAVRDDEYHAEDIDASRPSSNVGVAPLMAYAKSQGLYFGLSLEGSRIYARDDVNAKVYQFFSNRSVSPQDILTGKVPQPVDAERLYAALHQVEFAHELNSLPRPPKALVQKPMWSASDPPLDTEGDEFREFETRFREFMFGGVHIWRVRGKLRERRTLWLFVPEGLASLKLGFVSTLSNVEANRTSSENDDRRSVASEDVTLDSALMDNASISHHLQSFRTQVELSRTHSVTLTDVITLAQAPRSDVMLEDPSEARRLISIETQQMQQLQFLAKSDMEAKVLMAGLTLLLETESKRCGVRGGSGKNASPRSIKKSKNRRNNKSGYSSSDIEDDEGSAMSMGEIPDSWKAWSRTPGRSYLRGHASANDQGYPHYVHGQLIVKDIAKNVHLPLGLQLCRVLLLDSSSPVVSKWEKDRGDVEFERTPWTFPPATPRERDQFQSEEQLIASGSLIGAHRTISYQRPRNGQMVRLFETQIVEADDSEKLCFLIHERMPRRGFSVKVKMTFRASNGECEATVTSEIRPIGKDMSNPEAIHKAFLLVLDELRNRYGQEGNGLVALFVDMVNNVKSNGLPKQLRSFFERLNLSGEEKKEQEDVDAMSRDNRSIKLEDMLKSNASLGVSETPEARFQDRTPSPMDADKYRENYKKPKGAQLPSDTFDSPTSEPVMIEVKPLPKIRLSLMPSPREEDEFNLDEDGDPVKGRNGKGSGNHPSSGSKRSSRKSWGKRRSTSRKESS